MSLQPYWDERLHAAVKHFWSTRGNQASRQGAKTGARDAGNRTAVTGGKQLDGFVELVRDFLVECGIERSCVFCNQAVELPGWFRAEKKWDLLVVVKGQLIAAMEFKSQVGSFGNNLNNRTEESLGSATDIWTAYREGAFSLSQRPWLGYVMVLEEVARSLSPVGVKEPHFPRISRVPRGLLRKALRDHDDEAGARAVVRQRRTSAFEPSVCRRRNLS